MNEVEIEKLVVRITSDVKEYVKGMKDTEKVTDKTTKEVEKQVKKIEGFSKSIEGYARNAASALGGLATGAWLRQGLFAFAQQEEAQFNLSATLRATGRDVEYLTERYERFAVGLNRITGQSANTTREMLQQAELMGLSGTYAERAVRNAVALSNIVPGLSAQSALQSTGQMEFGDASGISNYIRNLNFIGSETGRITAAQQILNDAFEESENRTDTVFGQIQQISNAIHRMMVSFGRPLARLLEPVVQIVNQIVDYFDSMSDETKETIVTVMGLVASFLLLIPAIKLIGVAIGIVFSPMSAAIAGILVLIERWISYLGGLQNAWESATDLVTELLLRIEFTFQNFQQVAVWALTYIALKFVEFTMEFIHFFTHTIPALVVWFARNWREIFQTSFNFVRTGFTNLIQNLVRIFQNLPGLIRGRVRMRDIWTPLLEGFENTIRELPDIPRREMGELERALRDEFNRQNDAINRDFEEFRSSRQREMEERNNLFGRDGRGDGQAYGQRFGIGMRQGLEGTLFYSAEAIGRLTQHVEEMRFLFGRQRTMAGAMGGVGRQFANIAPQAMQVVNQGNTNTTIAIPRQGNIETNQANRIMIELLGQAVGFLRSIANREPIEVEENDVD